MIKIILPVVFAGVLIGCGGDEPVHTPSSGSSASSSSKSNHNAVGKRVVGVQPKVPAPAAVIKPDVPAPAAVIKPDIPGRGGPTPGAPPRPGPAHPSTNPLAPEHPPRPDPEVVVANDEPPTVEIDFMDEFDDGEPGHLRPVVALNSVPPQAPNHIGNAVEFIIGGVVEMRDEIIPSLIAVLTPMLSRDTGLFTPPNPEYPMTFWAASRGPELLLDVTADTDCGTNVVNENSPKTRCYLAMMIGTHVPVPAGYKPRDVSRQIGLLDFCEHNKEGIANELKKRAKNPLDYPGFADDPLPRYMLNNTEVATNSLTNGFAATWLSFCPNLVDALESEDRLKVFNHALYRMQISSLHTGGNIDDQFSREGVVRDRALAEILDDFLTIDRVQRLRRAVNTIRFDGAEEVAQGRGVQTDWAGEVGKQIFDYALGNTAATATYKLFESQSNNEFIGIKPGALGWAGRQGVTLTAQKVYKAAGRYIGWMIINGYQIPEDLSLMFFAKLMGRKIGWEAIKVYDYQKYTQYRNCLNAVAQASVIDGCRYIPSAIDYINGDDDMVDHWPSAEIDRRSILNNAVTNAVTFEVPNEYRILADGIYDVVPRYIFESGITTKDLRLRIIGERNVNVTDLILNLNIGRGYAVDSPQITWLCDYLREFDQHKLQEFVKFATNKRRSGIGGFARNPIQIVRMSTDDLRTIPRSHTCTGQIELPPYESPAILREKIDWALAPSAFDFL